jgi:hypothetical protein
MMATRAPKKVYSFIILILIGFVVQSCVESFTPETEIFEDALVIEATITNETKQQEVLLNRAFRFEEFVPVPEKNANVTIIDDLNNEYPFQEIVPGRYVSVADFGAEQGRSYQLLVTTNEGKEYASEPIFTPQASSIYGLRASRIDNEGEGMSIFVEYDASQTSTYYRYQYEETYQIIPPDWNSQMLAYEGPIIVVKARERDEQTCYKTEVSNNIILNRPQESNENNILQFPVRFIKRDNYIISHRYSILVKQLAISEKSYSFLQKLSESNQEENLFSQTQPGFFRGNVYSRSNRDERVLGFFHVASISFERLFFNYQDFFPNEPLPPYAENCFPFVTRLETPRGVPNVHELIAADEIRYHSTSPNFGEFIVVPRICGDCTVLGDVTVPEFWEE